MREALAHLAHPVLGHGLELRERLRRGEQPSLEAEQAVLVGLLDEPAGRAMPDFAGEPATRFLGLRYALACWLDELFILDSPWASAWNEAKLEVKLYDGNDRAWRFWEQAQLAAARQSPDALEGFLLCVLLGFGGERADDPAALSGWVAATRLQLGQGRGKAWASPPGLEPATHVPPLAGRGRLRTMLIGAAFVLLALIPAIALLLARRMG